MSRMAGQLLFDVEDTLTALTCTSVYRNSDCCRCNLTWRNSNHLALSFLLCLLTAVLWARLRYHTLTHTHKKPNWHKSTSQRYAAERMRKPPALATSMVHPRRPAQLPVPTHVWQNRSYPLLSPSVPLVPARVSTEARTSEALASSSSHLPSSEQEGQALAPQLFHLLQLQLRTALLHTHAAPSSSSSRPTATPVSRDDERLLLLRQLRTEVRVLGDVLHSHYQAYHHLRSSAGTEEAHRSPRAFGDLSGDKRRGKEVRAPVRLLPLPSSADQKWLQPLQQSIVVQMLARLTLAERLCRSVARGAVDQVTRTPRTRPANPDTELTLFYQECTRVVATLAALREQSESDALPLACLAHVLTASAAAGVPVPVHALVDAAGRAKMDGPSCGRDAGAAPSHASSWCSCVPWLLHRYETSRTQFSKGRTMTDWPVVSTWMTAAADRVCATDGMDLLQLSPLPLSSKPLHTSASDHVHTATPSRSSAELFGQWRGVLDDEAAAASCIPSSTSSAAVPTTPPDAVVTDTALSSWLLGKRAGTSQRGDACAVEGGLRPYWRAVIREVLCSGAEAVEALYALATTARSSARPSSSERRTRRDSSSSSLVEQQHGKRSSSLRHAAQHLKDVQFHAMGSHLSLRRITSSLQRHRRLAPLLQLHALVSGYASPLHAAGEKKEEEETGDTQSTLPPPPPDAAAVAALHRHRLLTGELMRGAPAAGRPQNGQHGAPRLEPIHQAGAMLWREVALLDAYTLITLGHVGEHAVDVAALEKGAVLRQVAWLQRECLEHLTSLAATTQTKEKNTPKHDDARKGKQVGEISSEEGRGSYRLTQSRAATLRLCLTPRTRATLIEKLHEGLRLSAKVLARWGESRRICELYLAHPSMGSSWEVGRALLQRGHYEEAVGVLQGLLESPAAGQLAPSAPTVLLLQSSSATAVRQLLLEAMQGAAAALVAQEQRHHSQQQRQQQETEKLTPVVDGTSATASETASSDAPHFESDADVPLPAELRAELHTLYTHSTALPVPLSLCLHAFMLGLTEASANTNSSSSCSIVGAGSWFTAAAPRASASSYATEPHGAGLEATVEMVAASSDEVLRRAAVLCTYLLRCHLAEQPTRGLLAKTVELWATSVSRYLCRLGDATTTATTDSGLPRLSATDRYLREVTVRLLYGCPHLPVARLLLTRVLQHYSAAGISALPLIASVASDASSSGSGGGHGGAVQQRVRAVWTVRWLLRHLCRYAGATARAGGEPQLAYPVCVPSAALVPMDGRAVQWWNTDFTELYTQDTLRRMPRIALEGIARLLSEGHSGDACGLDHVLARVQVALSVRTDEEDTQHQPWQCTTCYLWNGRYASACKRCQTLSTVLLQCRSCGFYTSSAGYRVTQGLGCEVCGTTLLEPAPASPRDTMRAPSPQAEPSTPHEATTTTTTTGTATVTGTGRPASLFHASAALLRAVSLRPWTCTHCRTPNQPHHVFFCRSCGRPPPPAATTATRDAAVSAVVPCGTCGHVAKATEGRLLPWCERCGALQQRLVASSPASSSSSSSLTAAAAASSSAAPSHGTEQECCPGVSMRRTPSLWWCGECTTALNPWTRTHCSMCGAGRPAGASEVSRVSSAASPRITVPWSMAACPSCGSPQRIGAGPCWKCGTAQVLPDTVKEAIATGWRLWLTQATHAAVSVANEASWETKEEEKERLDKVQAGALVGADCATTRPNDAGAGASVPLLLPRQMRWVCLREGCLHLNTASMESLDAKGAVGTRHSPVCCATCHAPRRHVEIFNPFIDRLAWRATDVTYGQPFTAAPQVVEALVLPRAPPHAMDVLVVEPEGQLEGSTALVPAVVRQRKRVATTTCASCGAVEKMDVAALSLRQVPPAPAAFLVKVCASCGHCSWGQSCSDHVAAWAASAETRARCHLLPGEEALALRLLLRSLTQHLQQAVAVVEAQKGVKASSRDSGGSAGQRTRERRTVAFDTTPTPLSLDWAWLSRHVLSAVHLLAAKGSERGSDVHDDAHCTLQHPDETLCVRDALLPWRGCDVAALQQLCSVEPRVAVLSDAAGTVHSALLEVREILEAICRLVELRGSTTSAVAAATPPKRSTPSRSAKRRRATGSRTASVAEAPRVLPLCLQDAWTRRLLLAALDLVNVVNRSTVFDEIGFATLRRLCRLLRPQEVEHIDTETKWRYLQEMKLSRAALLHGCVQCERCLTQHAPGKPCAPL